MDVHNVPLAKLYQAHCPPIFRILFLKPWIPAIGKSLRFKIAKQLLANENFTSKEAIDIGGGIGDWSLICNAMGLPVSHCDKNIEANGVLSQIVKKYSAEVTIKNIDIEKCRLEELQLEIFDYIFMFNVIDYFDSPFEMLDNIWAEMKIGSQLLISYPESGKSALSNWSGYAGQPKSNGFNINHFLKLKSSSAEIMGRRQYLQIHTSIANRHITNLLTKIGLLPTAIIVVSSLILRPLEQIKVFSKGTCEEFIWLKKIAN
jgi:2-polyprenyl-3-methyl-5-hydroxy-6-metoxy-1,4-benzoquinol methylase